MGHGNRFNITGAGKKHLLQCTAHYGDSTVKGPAGTVFEAKANFTGLVLFDFTDPADVVDLLQSVEVYLSR